MNDIRQYRYRSISACRGNYLLEVAICEENANGSGMSSYAAEHGEFTDQALATSNAAIDFSTVSAADFYVDSIRYRSLPGFEQRCIIAEIYVHVESLAACCRHFGDTLVRSNSACRRFWFIRGRAAV